MGRNFIYLLGWTDIKASLSEMTLLHSIAIFIDKEGKISTL
jgi:hypothetical protein